MHKIDDFLLDRAFQPISDFVSKKTNKTNYFLVRIFFIFCATFKIINCIGDFHTWNIICTSVICACCIFGCAVSYIEERRALRRALCGNTANPYRLDERYARIFWILFLVFTGYMIFVIPADMISFLFWGIAFYFRAVETYPPKAEWSPKKLLSKLWRAIKMPIPVTSGIGAG